MINLAKTKNMLHVARAYHWTRLFKAVLNAT